MSHTTAPWVIDDNAQIIADLAVLGRVYCGDIFPNEDLPECTANGYLIAAAPELLEALELVRSHGLIEKDGYETVVKKVGEAIAKAKGII